LTYLLSNILFNQKIKKKNRKREILDTAGIAFQVKALQ